MKSSRASLFWRWRNSGMSAASDVRPAAWSSPENTSASECVKTKETWRNVLQTIFLSYLTQKWHLLDPLPLQWGRTVRLTHYSGLILFSVAGMECHTVRQITTPSTGWNVRPAADTSVEGFWRWERDQISLLNGVNRGWTSQNSEAAHTFILGE